MNLYKNPYKELNREFFFVYIVDNDRQTNKHLQARLLLMLSTLYVQLYGLNLANLQIKIYSVSLITYNTSGNLLINNKILEYCNYIS